MQKLSRILLGMMFSGSVMAAPFSDFMQTSQFMIGVSPGVAWATGNKSQTFYLQPDIQKTYTSNNGSSAFPAIELFAGLQKPLKLDFLKHEAVGQIGLVLAKTGNAKLKGDIWEDADPAFNDFSYQYKVQHTEVSLKGRLIGNCGYYFEPYVSGSVGAGFNRASAFTIYPNATSDVPAPPFHSHTTTTFTYSLGIGVQKSFTKNLQVGLGYEFSDWGKTQLSRATGQTVNQGLTLNHLYANQVLLSLFYIF